MRLELLVFDKAYKVKDIAKLLNADFAGNPEMDITGSCVLKMMVNFTVSSFLHLFESV